MLKKIKEAAEPMVIEEEGEIFKCACSHRDHMIEVEHFVWKEKDVVYDNDIWFTFVVDYGDCISLIQSEIY
ncbi:MAG: hypothetical protein ACW96U_00730 [Candidatus Heimdallarchaeaceae archaeon]|jgi:hypothetical protein